MRILIVALMFALSIPVATAFARTEGIAAVVNQDAISMTDLNDRLQMVMASSGLPRTEEIRNKLTGKILDDLVTEQLKIQEMKRNNLSVSAEEIQNGFAMLAQQNKITLEQFINVMARDGINPATVERQIRAELGWSKVIQEVLRKQIEVTDSDIDQFIATQKEATGKSEYLLADIFLPVNESNPEAQAQQLANSLVQEINSGKAPFSKVAEQFSGAAGASRGGDLGWVQQGQMQTELEQAVAGMQKGQISNPVRTTDGYHILLLRDLRTIGAEPPSRDKVYSIIGVKRLERLQARELLELRTTAFIENRVES